MTVREIDGWKCLVSDSVRVATRGAESASYEPGGPLVVTCGPAGMVSIASAVVAHLMAIRPHRDAFHAHVDVCPRCINQPFDLCAEGKALLIEANK